MQSLLFNVYSRSFNFSTAYTYQKYLLPCMLVINFTVSAGIHVLPSSANYLFSYIRLNDCQQQQVASV